MSKKIAIIGRGTAGTISFMQYQELFPKAEIEWYYDPLGKTQTIGEASPAEFPTIFSNFTIPLSYNFLEKIKGSYKLGIRKLDWGGKGDFTHYFYFGNHAYHFDAVALQDCILDHFLTNPKSNIKIIPKYIKSHNDIDADQIIDCSGTPKNPSDTIQAKNIPVNSAYVVNCAPIDYHFSLHIARPYGWVFGIPLKDKLSIGYLYNNNLNTEEEIEKDLEELYKIYNFTFIKKNSTWSFNNYFRKVNYTERVTYNGNNAFFLEPMESNSISIINWINILRSRQLKHSHISLEQINGAFHNEVIRSENMILSNYCAGSKFDTPFWDMAKSTGEKVFKEMCQNDDFFKKVIEPMVDPTKLPPLPPSKKDTYGPWNYQSWKENITGFGLNNKLKTFYKH